MTDNVEQTQDPIVEANYPVETFEEFVAVLIALRKYRRHVTAAPTFKPKTFPEQIQLYDDGANRRLYLYVNGSWRYVALT